MRIYNRTNRYSLHPGELECKLCGDVFKNLHALEAHLRVCHQFSDSDSSDYYDRFLKKPDEGFCLICGAPTRHHKFKYDKACCKSHAAMISRNGLSSAPSRYDVLFRKQIDCGLHIDISDTSAFDEYKSIVESPASLTSAASRNKIIYKFQQNEFYREERDLFSTDPEIRCKLIENRCVHLRKSAQELTDAELLRGFKISGIHQSYSHFSPLWSKYFAEKVSAHVVADPFGGWGHHLVGLAAAGCKVYYNDLSHNVAQGVRNIADFISADCAVTENDAAEFRIPDDCDSVFMCPPYYNLEVYECGPFVSREKYDETMSSVFANVKASNARWLGVIIREDFEYLFDGMTWVSKEVVNSRSGHFNLEKKHYEFLYIFDLKPTA